MGGGPGGAGPPGNSNCPMAIGTGLIIITVNNNNGQSLWSIRMVSNNGGSLGVR